MKINWFAVARDVLMVHVLVLVGTLALTALATLLTDGITGGTQLLISMVLMAGAFCLSGCLAGPSRFKHLPLVALGVWLVRVADGLIRQAENLPGMVVGIVVVLVAMLVGGAASLAIKRGPAPSPPAG